MNFFKNSIWSIANIFGVQVIGILVNVILARMLYPELFGLLGMAYVFIGLIIVFQDSGLGAYIVYKDKVDNKLVSTSFSLNIFISTLLAVLFYLSSSSISSFFNEETLSEVIKYVAFGVFIGGFSITIRAILTKNKQFKKLTTIDVTAEIFSSIIAISCALLNFDILAITSRLIIKPFVQAVLLFCLSDVKVIGPISLSEIYKMVPYSLSFLGSQLFIYFNNNVDYFLIGKFLGSKTLGLYTMAYQWSVLARYYISGSINRVLFPEITSMKNDKLAIKKLYLNILGKISFLTFPVCIGLLVISEPFILFLYGDNWIEANFTLKILLLVGAITSIGTIGGSVFYGLGKPNIEMKLNMASFVFLVIVIIGLRNSGLDIIVLGILIKTIIFDSIKLILVNKELNIKTSTLIKTLKPSFISTFIMWIVLFFTEKNIKIHFLYMELFILIFIGIIVYLIISIIVNKENLNWYFRKASSITNIKLFSKGK